MKVDAAWTRCEACGADVRVGWMPDHEAKRCWERPP